MSVGAAVMIGIFYIDRIAECQTSYVAFTCCYSVVSARMRLKYRSLSLRWKILEFNGKRRISPTRRNPLCLLVFNRYQNDSVRIRTSARWELRQLWNHHAHQADHFLTQWAIYNMKNAVVWDVGIGKIRRFGGTYRLHHQGKKTAR
jgi:hypothetical protein